MNITNYDINEKNVSSKHHHLIPDSHFMIVGSTGQGKTNLLLNMLLKWMDFTQCIIYTINPDQEKYNFLTTEKEGVQILNPEEVMPVEELDLDSQKVIVFDDIKLDNKSMNNIKEYFSLSRNKNCNCIYLTQSYYDVPKYIRRNTNCFVLFGNLDNKDIRHICDDHAKGLNRNQLEEIYREATKEPFSFMTIDRSSKNKSLMYRKGFDGFWNA